MHTVKKLHMGFKIVLYQSKLVFWFQFPQTFWSSLVYSHIHKHTTFQKGWMRVLFSLILNSGLSDVRMWGLGVYPHCTVGKLLWNIWKVCFGGRIDGWEQFYYAHSFMGCGQIFSMCYYPGFYGVLRPCGYKHLGINGRMWAMLYTIFSWNEMHLCYI